MLKILMGALVMLMTQTSLYAGTTPTLENTTKLYVATFNRAPDAGGLEYWAKTAGLDLEGIAQSFFDQPETKAAYPTDSSTTDFVEAVYQNLFNRPSEAAGLTYWVGELDSGNIAKSTFILAVINGAQDTTEFGNDATILTNKTTVGLAFSNAGLNDLTDAREIMLEVSDDEASVTAALEDYGINVTPPTQLETLLAGKTLYGENNYDAWTFNETLTSISIIDVDAFAGSVGEIIPISVEGNIITFDEGSIEALYQDTDIKLTWISGPETGMVDNLWFDLATLESILGI